MTPPTKAAKPNTAYPTGADGLADGKTDVDGDGKPDTRIKDLTEEQAGQIYFRDYWYPAYCTDWPDGISRFVLIPPCNMALKKRSSSCRMQWASPLMALSALNHSSNRR